MFTRTLVLICICFSFQLKADYVIKGKVNLNDQWKPKVYMAAIHKLNDYYRTDSDLIIKTADVDADGNFTIEGNNLPNDKRFYRLYLMKAFNSEFDACLYFDGEDHNFIHVILDNDTKLEISTMDLTGAPFDHYKVIGDHQNTLMNKLATIVFPSFYFYKIKFPSEREFSEEQFQLDLKNFSDTCQNTLVALAAVANTDFDNFFDGNKSYYYNFAERLKQDIPNSIYTENYNSKLDYYSGSITKPINIYKYLFFGLALFLIPLLLYTAQLRAKMKQN
ncbi:MAG: hypothetical protein AAGK97_08785, partial [Bacteroidota bacterium]